jgi:hypothetical protein
MESTMVVLRKHENEEIFFLTLTLTLFLRQENVVKNEEFWGGRAVKRRPVGPE